MAALNQARASAGNVEIDCSKVRFVDPLGMSALAAAAKEVLAQGRRVAMPWLATGMITYLERMNFFVDLDIDAVEVPTNLMRHDQRSKMLEMTHMVDSGKSEAVADQVVSAIVTMIIGRGDWHG